MGFSLNSDWSDGLLVGRGVLKQRLRGLRWGSSEMIVYVINREEIPSEGDRDIFKSERIVPACSRRGSSMDSADWHNTDFSSISVCGAKAARYEGCSSEQSLTCNSQ